MKSMPRSLGQSHMCESPYNICENMIWMLFIMSTVCVTYKLFSVSLESPVP